MTQRLSFKKEMAQAIMQGKKTATSRDHNKKLGLADAIKGSRFKPVVFAKLNITKIEFSQWFDIIKNHYKEEGFESIEDMIEYLNKEKLMEDGVSGWRYFHKFEVIEVLK